MHLILFKIWFDEKLLKSDERIKLKKFNKNKLNNNIY